jgi:Domain of unknown function (DUF222)/HNH endonuclease
MQAAQVISRRSLDQLEQDIISLSSHINATEYEFLVLVREFDLRQGWKAYHFNNCAEWLNMKCGIAPGTAREKLRVANALFGLSATSRAFQKGDLSYSKARELTRVATPRTEEKLLDYAIPATALQVENHCRELRNVMKDASTADANRLHRQRYLSRSLHGDGSMTISLELPKESGDLVMKALELALNELELDADTFEGEERRVAEAGVAEQYSGDTHFARQADALVQIAKAYLAGGTGGKDRKSSTADHYQVMVHVDEDVLRNAPTDSSKSDLPCETIRRLCCDSGIVVVTKDKKGNPLSVSRKHRVVQPPPKRALLARDKCCRFPGCTHEKWLDAHHVEHWADGGETSLDNTILLCSTHHRLLHEGGFRIKKDSSGGEWRFKMAAG